MVMAGRTCREAILAEADWLAVATPEEAIAVRQSGCHLPLLLFMSSGLPGRSPAATAETIDRPQRNLDGHRRRRSGGRLRRREPSWTAGPVHIKIDSGMTRSGCRAEDAPALVIWPGGNRTSC